MTCDLFPAAVSGGLPPCLSLGHLAAASVLRRAEPTAIFETGSVLKHLTSLTAPRAHKTLSDDLCFGIKLSKPGTSLA